MRQPASVASPIATASVAITAYGGRPPFTRQAMPTNIAPTAVVTPATGWPAAISPPSSATIGIAASAPPVGETAVRLNCTAACAAAVSVEDVVSVVDTGRRYPRSVQDGVDDAPMRRYPGVLVGARRSPVDHRVWTRVATSLSRR